MWLIKSARVRLISRIVLGMLLLGFITAGGLYLWLGTSLPETSGTLNLGGLEQQVQLYHDSNGVPHIFAANEHDAYLTLGFVHAQDRLVQMDLMRRFGAGRLSEIVGQAGLDSDKMMRTIGIYRLAEASFNALSPEAQAAFTAYAQGVNDYIATHHGAWPVEYYFLRSRPELWKPADSLVWGRIMALQLGGNWRGIAVRAELAAGLSPELYAALFPQGEAGGPFTIGLGNAPLDPAAEALRVIRASNAWTVDGKHTDTGKPILANDPHLGLDSPEVWYLARIETPNLSLKGATVPGVPFHVLGTNGAIAWGMTTTGADTQSLFIERLSENNPESYDTPGGSRPFDILHETINIRHQPPLNLSVRWTLHGPVISDLNPDYAKIAGENRVLSLSSTAFSLDDRSAEAIYSINHAGDWDGFQAALRNFRAPAQNFMFASQGGDIGFIMAGLIPIRRGADGFLPSRGWLGEGDWVDAIPFGKLPQTLNPATGRLVNANNRVVAPDYPYTVTLAWDSAYRAGRITEVLNDGKQTTVDNTIKLQMDTVSPSSADLLPILLSAPGGSKRAIKVRQMLAAWDGDMKADQPEPLIYATWLRFLEDRIYASRINKIVPTPWIPPIETTVKLLNDNSLWCDDPETPEKESCDDAIVAALNQAVAALADRYGGNPTSWRWSEAHKVTFANRILSNVPLLGGWGKVSRAVGGGWDTINRAAYAMAATRRSMVEFAVTHGPGYRGVYDLSNPENSRFVIALGQSGNVMSPHYADFVDDWLRGMPIKLSRSAEDLTKSHAEHLILNPPPGLAK